MHLKTAAVILAKLNLIKRPIKQMVHKIKSNHRILMLKYFRSKPGLELSTKKNVKMKIMI